MEPSLFPLIYWIPLLYLLSVALIMALLFANWRKISRDHLSFSTLTWMLLIIILAATAFVQTTVFKPVHLIYLDEHIYLGEARNMNSILQGESCDEGSEPECRSLPSKGVMWPFLLSISFLIFGPSVTAAFLAIKILSISVLVLMFVFSSVLFKNEKVGLWAGAILALWPWYSIWSNTLETTIPSLFFILFTLTTFTIYMESRGAPLGIATVLLLIFSILTRFENALLIFPLGLIFLTGTSESPSTLLQKRLRLFFPFLIWVICISTVAIFFLSIGFFRPNYGQYLSSLYFIEIPLILPQFPFILLFAIPACFGIIDLWARKKDFTLVLLPFMMYVIIYLPLASESRFIIIPSAFASVIFAHSIEKMLGNLRFSPFLSRGVVLFVLLFMTSAIIYSSPLEEFLGDRYHYFTLETTATTSLESSLLPNCSVISTFPQIIFGATGANGIKTSHALSNPQEVMQRLENGECIYYFEDRFCFPESYSYVSYAHYIQPNIFSKDCERLKHTLHLSLQQTFSDGNVAFYLYRVIK